MGTGGGEGGSLIVAELLQGIAVDEVALKGYLLESKRGVREGREGKCEG